MANEQVVGTAVVVLTTDDTQLRAGLNKGKKTAEGWSQEVAEETKSSIGNVLNVAGGMLAVQGIRALTSSISEMLQTAVQLEPVRRTFDNLIESVGGDAVMAMDAMRDATRGMVDETQLLAAGNQLLAMGIADSTAGLADQIEVAVQLGTSMGRTAAQSIEDWALLNANMSFQRLDFFGISAGKVRTRVNELMASVKGMTRELAFQTATMEEARVSMARVGEQGVGTAADLARVASEAQNVKTLFGEIIVSAIETGGALDVVSKALQSIRANLQQGQTFEEMQQGLRDLHAAAGLTADELQMLLGQSNALQLNFRRGRIDAEEFAAGLAALTAQAEELAAVTTTVAQDVDRWAVELRDAAVAARETAGELDSIDLSGFATKSLPSFKAGMRALITESSKLPIALKEAFDSEAIGDALRDMGVRAAQIMEDIQGDFADIAQAGADQRREILFAHNLDQLQAQAAFENEFAALTAAGRTDDANDLQAAFANQQALSERQLAIRLQLQQRSILLQKIEQAKAHVAELTEQADQIRRVFATELAASESFQKLEIATQQAILQAVFEGGSQQLQLEATIAEARRKISADISAGIITDAVTARKAVVAAIGGDLGAAQDALDSLQGIFDNWKPELPPLPTFDLGDVGGVGGGGTDRQIAETVTKPLSQAVNEIARAVTAAKKAMETLIGFELGEGVEQGFDELGKFVALGITKFQGWFEDDPGLEPALDAIKDLFGPVGELLQLLSIDVSQLATFAGDFLPEATRFVWQIRIFVTTIRPWLEAIAEHWGAEEVAVWAGIAKSVASFFAIMPNLEKVAPIRGPFAGPQFVDDATRYIWQIREFSVIIRPWLAAVAKFWTPEEVAKWAGVARSLKDFFAILPDLSKVSPVEAPTFTDDATRYIWQVREFTTIIQPWFKAIADWWTPDKVAEWADVAKNVASFFAVMPDLSRIVPSDAEDFKADALEYVWQIRAFATEIQPWLQDIAKWWTPARVEVWAGIAKNIAAFFDIMPDFSRVVPQTGDFKSVFKGFAANIRFAAKVLSKELEAIRTGELGDVLDELALTADALGSVLGLLNLAKMFEDLQRVEKLKKGEFRTALSNIIVIFIEQLRQASLLLKAELPGIEAIWDGMLDGAVIFADKIAQFFTAIRDAIVAGGDIVRETDFDVDTIIAKFLRLQELGLQIGPLVPALDTGGLDVLPGDGASIFPGSQDVGPERVERPEPELVVVDIRLDDGLRARIAKTTRRVEVQLRDQMASETSRRR